MEESNIKRTMRNRLAVLADNVHIYSKAIRKLGFTSSHVNEDWISKNCSSNDIAVHHRYLIEYARASLREDSSAKVIWSDDWQTHSALINELKKNRYDTYGQVDALSKNTKTRHLVELSPCFRELSRIAEGASDAEIRQEAVKIDDFKRRRANELVLHNEDINHCISALGAKCDKQALQSFYAERLGKFLAKYGVQLCEVAQMYGERKAVVLEINENILFLIIPVVVTDGIEEGGSTSVAFRLADKDVLQASSFVSSKYVVLNLDDLLPGKYIDYGRFNSPSEFCLNLLAWNAAIELILPDVINTLRENKQ